ncbi:MAG: gamma-glutamyltransferase [Planctomycetaceae bacterium]|nr:MAG: gamma-glutamyltransferase [Planctomycetaceae bacterium]
MQLQASTDLTCLSGRHAGQPSRPLRDRSLGAVPWAFAILVLGCLLLVGTVTASQAQPQGRAVLADAGMVVSASAPASQVGADVLRDGGNAVDAAVAVALALAVTWPEAGNLGGGGFMLVCPPDGRPPICVDYRETAPAAATADMYAPDESTLTHRAVGVPGTVRGLAVAHAQYGRLSWARLVQPAEQLARHGFLVDHHLAASIHGVLERKETQSDERFAELRRVFEPPDGQRWAAGQRLVQPDLAETLQRLADGGPGAFYSGLTAELIEAEMVRGGGLITRADLASYEARLRDAIQGQYRQYEIVGPPPPSSGGIAVVQALNILETFDLSSQSRFSVRNLHLIAEAQRRAFRDRALHLGDPDFVPIPTHLIDKQYARELAASIQVDRATPSLELAEPFEMVEESPETTHFSIIDADGLAVANTYTLEASWGSRIVVTGAGFVLNNEMGDFNWVPGRTDQQGRIGTPPNVIAPRKRMLSSMTPMIVKQDDRVLLITGSPGGRTIISTVLQMVLNVVEFQMDLPTAVAAPRQHHAWFPDRFDLERGQDAVYGEAIAGLEDLGHVVRQTRQQGSAHSIWVDPQSGVYVGVADERRGGAAVGVHSAED